jgi:hypothetical protein
MHVSAVESASGEWRQFQQRRAGINQEVHALAGKHFPAGGVPLAGCLTASGGNLAKLVAKLGDERTHSFGVAREVG